MVAVDPGAVLVQERPSSGDVGIEGGISDHVLSLSDLA
jgi:hypothetical protein